MCTSISTNSFWENLWGWIKKVRDKHGEEQGKNIMLPYVTVLGAFFPYHNSLPWCEISAVCIQILFVACMRWKDITHYKAVNNSLCLCSSKTIPVHQHYDVLREPLFSAVRNYPIPSPRDCRAGNTTKCPTTGWQLLALNKCQLWHSNSEQIPVKSCNVPLPKVSLS